MKRETKVRLIAAAVGVVAFLIAWGLVEALGPGPLILKLLLAAAVAVIIGVGGLVLYNRWRMRK
ncbi:MAG: hypothetical protein ABJB03_02630 [Rhodoglobus sp.]